MADTEQGSYVEQEFARDTNYIPDTSGFFSIGKAMSGRRDATDRTNDAVYVDWLEISKPA